MDEAGPSIIDLRDSAAAPSLLLLGGAPRTGKSLLARALWQQDKLPSFSMDALVAGFMRLAPEAGIDWAETPARAERIAIAAYLVAQQGLTAHDRYLLEGESITPVVADSLRTKLDVQACFLVLCTPVLADIIGHETADSWVGDLDAEDQRRTIDNIAARSQWLVEECNRRQFPYVDMGAGRYESQQALSRDLLLGGLLGGIVSDTLLA